MSEYISGNDPSFSEIAYLNDIFNMSPSFIEYEYGADFEDNTTVICPVIRSYFETANAQVRNDTAVQLAAIELERKHDALFRQAFTVLDNDPEIQEMRHEIMRIEARINPTLSPRELIEAKDEIDMLQDMSADLEDKIGEIDAVFEESRDARYDTKSYKALVMKFDNHSQRFHAGEHGATDSCQVWPRFQHIEPQAD